MNAQGTKRRLDHAVLRGGERLFRAVISQAEIGITQGDVEGKWFFLNRRFCAMLGYTQAELTNQRSLDFIHPDDREGVRDAKRWLAANETSFHRMEVRYLHRTGTIICTSERLSLVRDQNNRPYVISVIEDITEKIETAEALRQSELLNKQLLDNIPQGIFILDVTSDGRFKFAGLNPVEEKAVGISSAAVAGGFVEDVLSEDLTEKLTAHYRRCLEVGTVITYEEELNLPIGRRYFRTSLIPVRNPAGRIHRIVGCCTDLTGIVRSQDDALARQKLESMGLMASGMAHDINNLLSGIIASAELALAHGGDDSRLEEELRRIRTIAIRGTDILRQLMVCGGKESPVFERVDISGLVEEMLQLLKVSVSKHAVLKAELGRHLPAAYANPAQIRQIVMNLVFNASEAIGARQGTIRITTGLARACGGRRVTGVSGVSGGNYLQIEVSDNGCGMTPEVRARIFDPFFSTKYAGRGLGLAVTQEIIQAHGGAIDVVSAPGQGTRFQVLLPCAAMSDQKARTANADNVREQSLGLSGTLLVVEDEEILRLTLSKLLRKNGFSVIEADGGSAALNLMRAHEDEVEVILLDATVTGMSGQEFLEEAHRIRPGVKVILTSAYSKERISASFTGQRMERFIQKPFRLVDLLSLIRDALSEVSSEA